MKPHISLFIFFLMTIALSGCKKPGQEYFPYHEEGTQQDYVVQYTTPFAGIQRAGMVIRYEGKTTIRGKEYGKTVTVLSGIPGVDPVINYCRQANDGIYCISDKHKELPEYLSTPLPLTVGESWTSKAPEGTSHFHADAIETLELADKSYPKCLRITSEGTNGGNAFSDTSYWAPGIGLIKETEKILGITIDAELRDKN